jgi:2-polyprenyl-3-methyl-5-hydroxy-6-metoxy-1,4-benzoquinol methylase
MQVLYKLPAYYRDIINHLVNTDLEVNMLDGIFRKFKVKSVLDVACGVGRHAIPLAKRGYQVTGIDFSPFQIKKSKEDAKTARAQVRFIRVDANAFVYPEEFDAAICMWTTLGEEPLQYRKVIRNVLSSLKPGGIFVVDNRSWEYIPKKKEQYITDRLKLKDGTRILTQIHDRYTEHFRIRDSVTTINGKKYDDLCITHTFKENDWIGELREAGFKKFLVYHNRKPKRLRKPTHVTIIAIR